MKMLFLFDLDGTLITTGGAGLRALDKTFRDLFGWDKVLDTLDPSGKTDPAIFREIVATHRQDAMREEERKKITKAYLGFLKMEMEASAQWKIYAGVREFLDLLKQRGDVIVGLGTGNLEQGARIKLEPTGLNPYFSFGGFGSDAEDRAQLLRVAHMKAQKLFKIDGSPESVFVIGDTGLDVQAARRAGFRSVAVSTGGQTEEELLSQHPHFFIKDMTEGEMLLHRIDSLTPGS